MDPSVSHDRSEESLEAKARWFQSLSLSERIDLLCWFTNLALAVNPGPPDRKDARPTRERIRVIEAA